MAEQHPFTRIRQRREEDGTITFVPLGSDFAAPRRFVASGDLISLDIEVSRDGIGRCLAVEVRAGSRSDPLTSASLRLPLATLTRQAVAAAARMYTPVGESDQPVFRLLSTPSDAGEDFYQGFTEKARRPRSGSPLTDDHLRQVAELYRAAVKRGDPPDETIAREMHAARSTAARWVAKARERGILGPSVRGRAGEAES